MRGAISSTKLHLYPSKRKPHRKSTLRSDLIKPATKPYRPIIGWAGLFIRSASAPQFFEFPYLQYDTAYMTMSGIYRTFDLRYVKCEAFICSVFCSLVTIFAKRDVKYYSLNSMTTKSLGRFFSEGTLMLPRSTACLDNGHKVILYFKPLLWRETLGFHAELVPYLFQYQLERVLVEIDLD